MIEMQETQPDPVFEPDKANCRKKGRQWDWSNWLMCVSALALAVVVLRNGWEAIQQHQRTRAVRCDLPVFDFGEAFVGEVIDHTFHVINVSRTSLEIGKIQTSCGCTTVATKLEGTVVGPGEAFDVPVKLALSSAEDGEFQRPVEVRFTGEPTRHLRLKLKGRVSKRWIWSKDTVIFDGIRTDEVASRTVELTRSSGATVGEMPQMFAVSKGFLRVDAENLGTAEDGATHRFKITTVPPLSPGRQEASLYESTPSTSVPIAPVRIILIVTE
ncbi:MAG: DUF1573 domain-containing protein [Planctomycetes bacterium]|nr:DUF1573 domain-containing protein [Planctomycetota bacterium]